MTTRPGSTIPFIDRESALRRLRTFVEGPGGRCLVVIGRSRIGKSRLLQHFADNLEQDQEKSPIAVLHEISPRGTVIEEYTRLEKEISGHPLIRRLVYKPEMPDWVPDLLGWLRRILAAAEPTAGSILLNIPLEKLAYRAARRERSISDRDIIENLLKSLHFLSKTLGDEQRLLIILDPSTDYDHTSQELRKFLVLRDIVANLPERLLIIVALRESDPATAAVDFFELPNVETYRGLNPFEPEDIHDLLTKIFGPQASFDTALAVHRKYAGDPFSTELAIDLALRDREEPLKTLVDKCPEELTNLMRLYHDNLQDQLQRRILRVLSIAAEPVGLDFIVALLGDSLTTDSVYSALRAPELKRPVMVLSYSEGDRYRLFHDTFGTFLLELTQQLGESTNLHQRAGIFFEEQEDPARALHHFGYAQDVKGVRRNLRAGLRWHRFHGETRRLKELYELLRPLSLSPDERFLLGKSHAWSLSKAGETEAVVQMVDRLLPHAPEDNRERAELLLLRGDSYHNASRYDESYRDFQDARQLLEATGHTDTLLYRQIRLEAAHMETHLGKFRESVRNHRDLEQSQQLHEGQRPAELVVIQWARELRRYGEVLVFTGEWDLAEELLDSARETFKDYNHSSGQGNAYRRLADLCLLRGGSAAYEQALSYARRAYELLTGVGSRGASWLDFVTGEALRGLGRLEEAHAVHSTSLQRYRRGSSPHLLSMAELTVAETERMRDGELRFDLYDLAVQRYESTSFEWGLGTALTYRGLANLQAGRSSESVADLTKAQHIFDRLALPPAQRTVNRIQDKKDLGFHPIIVL